MATNIPQDDFHKTGLRLPKDLHAKLHEAAASAGRTYNSEIVSRLQESFELRAPAIDALRAQMDAEVRDLQMRGEMLAVRVEMARLRADALMSRQHAIELEAEALTRAAQTDEDFARADAKGKELAHVEQEAKALHTELQQLLDARADTMGRFEAMRGMLKDAGKALEDRLAAAKRTAPPEPESAADMDIFEIPAFLRVDPDGKARPGSKRPPAAKPARKKGA